MVTTSSTCVCRTIPGCARWERSPRPVSVGVCTLCPCPASRGTSLFQHQPPNQAECTRTKVCHLTPCRHDRSAACPGSAGASACLGPALTLAGSNPVLLALPRASLQAPRSGKCSPGPGPGGADRRQRPQRRPDAAGASRAEGEEDGDVPHSRCVPEEPG